MKTESDIVRFVKEQHGKMSVEQIALQLAVDPAYIVKIRQKAGLNNIRKQELAQAAEDKKQIAQIIKTQGPQTAKELVSCMGLTVSTVNNRICLLKRKGLVSFLNPDNLNRGNGRWHLSEQTTAPEPDQTSGVYMHSLPLSRLPEFFKHAQPSQ